MIATVGVSEALYLTFTAILEQGDEVIIPTPCFVSYQAEVILAGGVPVEIPRNSRDFHTGVTLAALRGPAYIGREAGDKVRPAQLGSGTEAS